MTDLTDTCKMPFGKHKGQLMQDVPASYLHWLWSNGMRTESTPVANYIRDNLSALQQEHPDGIW
jgi:Putative quorum-sensing-regulated virulence factor